MNDCFFVGNREIKRWDTFHSWISPIHYSSNHEPWIRPLDETYATSVMMDETRLKVRER
jgi:hypothetical protein